KGKPTEGVRSSLILSLHSGNFRVPTIWAVGKESTLTNRKRMLLASWLTSSQTTLCTLPPIQIFQICRDLPRFSTPVPAPQEAPRVSRGRRVARVTTRPHLLHGQLVRGL